MNFSPAIIRNAYLQPSQQVRASISNDPSIALPSPDAESLVRVHPSIFEIAFAPMATRYSSTFVHQHPFPSLCKRNDRATSCNEYHDCGLPRHIPRRFRRSDALRLASRARRRNKRFLHPRWFAVFGRTGKRGHDLRLRLRSRLSSRLLLLGLSLDTLNIVGLGCVGWESIWEFFSRVGLIKVGLFSSFWRPRVCSGAAADIGFQHHYYYSDIAVSRPVSLCFFYLVAFIN